MEHYSTNVTYLKCIRCRSDSSEFQITDTVRIFKIVQLMINVNEQKYNSTYYRLRIVFVIVCSFLAVLIPLA